MPSAVPVPVRREIWRQAQLGEATGELARAYSLPPRTVRSLCRRFRDHGPAAIGPAYHAPTPPAHAKAMACRDAVCRTRREHPTWGAGLIRVVLREGEPRADWPSERTAQRWLRGASLGPAPKGRRPSCNPERATEPHEVWQMDAAECIPLANGDQVCWLRIVDEFTGAVLRTTLFPPAAVEPGRRSTHAGRAAARFRAVGFALVNRVDNGTPWGSDDGLPTELECWLIGLGVTLVLNSPYRPQKYGVVERSQGVAKQWAEPRTCATAEELQSRLDAMDRRQREAYPRGPTGQSRTDAHPALTHSGRVYDATREAEVWCLGRLTDHLADNVIRRKVDSQGKISVYNTQRLRRHNLPSGDTRSAHLIQRQSYVGNIAGVPPRGPVRW